MVTDEVSADLDTALELIRSWGIQHVELRGVGEGRYPRVSSSLRALTPQLIAAYEMSVVALSPGLFKFPLGNADDPPMFYQWASSERHRATAAAQALLEDHLDNLLPESIQAAVELGCPIITCFSFSPPGPALYREMLGATDEPPLQVIEALREAGRRCAEAGLILAVENEMTCWGATAARTADIVRAVAEPNVGITWDPANAYLSGATEPFPRPYEEVADYVRLVHFKDVRVDPATGRREFCVQGDIDWAGQIAALRMAGYSGAVSIETHMRPKVAPTAHLADRLRHLLGSDPNAHA
uniref:sugar phosphate isomerase/epimerase family protein n=1 Tax=Nonomuraea bangladeshensis TaxID=404385 RepID=UPI003F49610B